MADQTCHFKPIRLDGGQGDTASEKKGVDSTSWSLVVCGADELYCVLVHLHITNNI